ncbi:MAG: beta-galactosidase, partial [Lentisphaeria bacterium]|nr:beta-galactosidase [Lentisphaeria bacterium]
MDKEFEKNWRFTRDVACERSFMLPEYPDGAWETVDVPHDWAIKGPFDEKNDAEITIVDVAGGREWKMVHPGRTGGLPHVGKGFYRKKFFLSEIRGKHIRIEFDGVMSRAKVYCNGAFVTTRPNGYSSFCADISPFVKEGENLLAVSAENLPGASRWYPGAGIYRHARRVEEGETHVEMWGVRVSTRENVLYVQVKIANPSGKAVPLVLSVLDGTGRLVAEKTVQAVEEVRESFTLENVKKWSIEEPNLYTLVTKLEESRKETLFGFRDMVFDPHDGFFLNGKKMKFQGVCLHHDLGIIGAAVDRDVTQHRLEQLKSIGCNAIRTSHNPPDPELLDLCDKMGFLVICEAYDEWKLPKCPNGVHLYFDEWGERDLKDMIRRDANHPCVMMWSIGNEIDEQYTPDGPVMTERLCAVCHQEDPTRPVTAGLNNGDDSITGGLFDGVDVKGFNYKPYIYSLYHHTFPDAPMYASESASTISSRGEYSDYLFEEMVKKPDLQIDSFDL